MDIRLIFQPPPRRHVYVPAGLSQHPVAALKNNPNPLSTEFKMGLA